jgi:hypothetical protein
LRLKISRKLEDLRMKEISKTKGEEGIEESKIFI